MRFIVLIVLLLLALFVGWRFLAKPSPSNERALQETNVSAHPEGGSSVAVEQSATSFVKIDEYQFDLIPLEPCGALGQTSFGVLAGTFDADGEFMPDGRQLLIRAEQGYSYAVYFPGEGGSIIRKLCTGEECNIFDVETNAFVGEISEGAAYQINCDEAGEKND